MSNVTATLLNVLTPQTAVHANEGGTITWQFVRLDDASSSAEVVFAPSEEDLEFAKTYLGYDPAHPLKVVWEAGDQETKYLTLAIPNDDIDTPHAGWMTWHLTGVGTVRGVESPDLRFVAPDSNGGFSVPVSYYDNDGPSNVSIVASRPSVTEGQQSVFTFEVTREALGFQGDVQVTVQFGTYRGETIDLSRFGLSHDPIIVDLPYWQSSKQIEVSLPDDSIHQLDETLRAEIVKAVYIQGGVTGNAPVYQWADTIRVHDNDDPPPTILLIDLSTNKDGSPIEITSSVRPISEGGVLHWQFTRQDASAEQEFRIAPSTHLTNPSTYDTDYDYVADAEIFVHFAVGETEKTVTLNVLDDDVFTRATRDSSWKIIPGAGTSADSIKIASPVPVQPLRIDYRIADDDGSGAKVIAHLLPGTGSTVPAAEEGGTLHWMFERTDFSKDMVIKVTPDALNQSLWPGAGEWAKPIYVHFAAGSHDPVYLDMQMPDNAVFNVSPWVGLRFQGQENVSGITLEGFDDYWVRNTSGGGKAFPVEIRNDDPLPTVAVHALADAIYAADQTYASFEIIRTGDIAGTTKVTLQFETVGADGQITTDAQDMTFQQGMSKLTASMTAFDLPEGVLSKDITLKITQATNYIGSSTMADWNKDVITCGSATITVFNPDEMAAGPIARFYNPLSGEHFLTASPAERDAITATMPVFQFEGEAFSGLNAQMPGAKEVWRFYDTASGNHFFTANDAERDDVLAHLPTFHLEGIGFYAAQADGVGLTEVYRFYNTVTGDHLFTISTAEREAVIQHHPDYVQEGIAFYVPQAEPIIA